jgi:hypothetical protein
MSAPASSVITFFVLMCTSVGAASLLSRVVADECADTV